MTIQDNGFVNGAYIHGAGTLAPGGFNLPGTITFNSLANPSVLTLGAGSVTEVGPEVLELLGESADA